MSRLRKTLAVALLLILTLTSMHSALAWDSVGHRLSAAVASHYLNNATKSALIEILQQHPRFQQDFQQQMPTSISRGDQEGQHDWLLGQAAFWPDITRSLQESERRKYNRANWHYIDGAWLRDQANVQGNTYLGIAPFADVTGATAESIDDEEQVDNIMNALDYNTALLADSQSAPSQRAVALCWVLHLVGDIHQPLHVGSLYTANRFSTGDRGGNGIETEDRNLHARWDRALREAGVSSNLQAVLVQHSATLDRMGVQDAADWSRWMKESRALLLNTVYSNEMKSAILRAERSAERLSEFTLDADYVAAMEYHSRLRLALAGRRLGLWLEEAIGSD
jgi:S1/P1 Nuclease